MLGKVFATAAAVSLAALVFTTVASASPPDVKSVSCAADGTATITYLGNPLYVDFRLRDFAGNILFDHTVTRPLVGGDVEGHTISYTPPGADSDLIVQLEYVVGYDTKPGGIDKLVDCTPAPSQTVCEHYSGTFSTDSADNLFTLQSGDTFLWACNGHTSSSAIHNALGYYCLHDAVNLGYGDDEFYNLTDFTCATRS